jgi:hypothetical protein
MKNIFIALALALAVAPAAAQETGFGTKLAGTQSMNPDLGLVMDAGVRYISGATRNDPDANRLRMRAAELVATQYVDSFARLDVVAAAEENALNVEEAYATLFELPLKTKLRLGKFFIPFGILNTYHNHDLPQTDRPLALERLLGGEYADQGVEASWLLPNRWDLYSEVTVALVNGDRFGSDAAVAAAAPSGGLWENTGRAGWGQKAQVLRWANFFPVSDEGSLLLGVSYARGENPANATESRLAGADFKYRYVWPDMRKFTLQGEQFWLRERQHYDDGAGYTADTLIKPQGGYLYAEYQFVPKRWAAGARADWAGQRFFDPRLASAGDLSRAGSAYVTYSPSEFQRWRLQYRHSDLNELGRRRAANELAVQATFIIGFHPAHKF